VQLVDDYADLKNPAGVLGLQMRAQCFL